MRNLTASILIILSLGCTESTNEQKDYDPILSLVKIKQLNYDSLTFVPKLTHYKYYNQDLQDSLTPPKASPRHINEFDIAYSIASKDLFKGKDQLDFLQKQILDTLNTFEMDFSGLNQNLNESSRVSNHFISFYRPLFNLDSTAVYIQYEIYDNGYIEGEGLILRRNGKSWDQQGLVTQWMN